MFFFFPSRCVVCICEYVSFVRVCVCCEYVSLSYVHSGEKCGVDGTAEESVGVPEPLMVGDSSPGDSSSYSCMILVVHV